LKLLKCVIDDEDITETVQTILRKGIVVETGAAVIDDMRTQ